MSTWKITAGNGKRISKKMNVLSMKAVPEGALSSNFHLIANISLSALDELGS
jgi:hypothetical protein